MTRTDTEVIPLAKPVIGEAEEQAVLEVLRSGQLSLGPRLPAFEEAFAARVGARHACAVSSGTTALHLCMRAVGVERGDEVVTTPFSFVATANAVLYQDAVPVFADIDAGTLNLDPDAAAAAITGRTSALLPVHIFGLPADMGALERHGLPIVEDAAQALGARYADGGEVGGRGHPAIFGFYANKQLVTGEGGMITLGSAEHKERIDSERNQGRAPDMGWLDHDRLGFNYRLSDIACALGLAQLARLDDMLAARERVAAAYFDALSGLASERGLRLPREETGGAGRSWFVYVVQVPHGADRDAVDPRAARARRAVQALPARDPPHVLLPRALRAPAGRVPGLRGRRRPLPRAPVLPGDDRVAGRPGRRGAHRRNRIRVARRTSHRHRRGPGPERRSVRWMFDLPRISRRIVARRGQTPFASATSPERLSPGSAMPIYPGSPPRLDAGDAELAEPSTCSTGYARLDVAHEPEPPTRARCARRAAQAAARSRVLVERAGGAVLDPGVERDAGQATTLGEVVGLGEQAAGDAAAAGVRVRGERVDVQDTARRAGRDDRGRVEVAHQHGQAPRRGAREGEADEAARELVAVVRREGGEHAEHLVAGVVHRHAADLPARRVPRPRVQPRSSRRARAAEPTNAA